MPSAIEEASAKAVELLKSAGATEIIPLSDGTIFLARGSYKGEYFKGVYHVHPADMNVDQFLVHNSRNRDETSLDKWGLEQMELIARSHAECVSALEQGLNQALVTKGWIENAKKDLQRKVNS